MSPSSPPCIYAPFPSAGHKHRHKRHKPKRRPAAGVATVPGTASTVGARMFNDLESLSASLAGDALLRSERSAAVRPSNDSSADSGPHRRSKRFLSYPRFVEVMLVADSKMVEHHGSNLQHYILTLMSIVSAAPSLASSHILFSGELHDVKSRYISHGKLSAGSGPLKRNSPEGSWCEFC